LPPAARGALFEKTAPLDPPQKLLFIFIVLERFLACHLIILTTYPIAIVCIPFPKEGLGLQVPGTGNRLHVEKTSLRFPQTFGTTALFSIYINFKIDQQTV
jgi:hypothetical protein